METSMKNIFCFIILFLLLSISVPANIVDPFFDMIYEKLDVEIYDTSDTLHASFSGEYHFDFSQSPLWFFFPAFEDVSNFHVWTNNEEIPWEWEHPGMFPTNVPEKDILPGIYWQCDVFTTGTSVFKIEYEHDLIKRKYEYPHVCEDYPPRKLPDDSDQYIYIYPFSRTYSFSEPGNPADIDILMPEDYPLTGVWIAYYDYGYIFEPLEYTLAGQHILISFDHILDMSLIVAMGKHGTAAHSRWNLYE